jgi:ATP-dependent DNA helicase RecG
LGVLRPRNFAILLFGRNTQRFIPGAVTFFSIYPGVDRSDPHSERHELDGNILEQARQLQGLLDIESYTAFDKTDPTSPNVIKQLAQAEGQGIPTILRSMPQERTTNRRQG